MAGPKLDVVANKSIEGALYEPLSVSFSLGVQYNISRHFFVEGRYGLGLSNELITNGNSETFGRNTLRLGIGLKF